MVRFVYNLDNRSHIDSRNLLSLSWLSVPDRVRYFKLIHLFKIKHGIAPRYLSRNIVSVSDTHAHNTRGSASNFHVSKSLSSNNSAFAFSCVMQWNALPNQIKSIDSLSIFKRELRKFLLSSYDWLCHLSFWSFWFRLLNYYAYTYSTYMMHVTVEKVTLQFLGTLLETSHFPRL